jgi:hypothetical protein
MKRSFVSPFFAWTEAALRGGHLMLEQLQEAAKQARAKRVGVIPTADAPPRKPRRKAAAKAKRRVKAKGKSRRR